MQTGLRRGLLRGGEGWEGGKVGHWVVVVLPGERIERGPGVAIRLLLATPRTEEGGSRK